MEVNPLLLTDSYKFSHFRQYPPGTQTVYSYFESRGGDFPEVVFFGLQYLLEEYLTREITRAHIDEAEALVERHMGTKALFNRAGWEHIVADHGGHFPVRIKAIPEGTPVAKLNVLMTVENTCPQCFWVTNYLETLLSQVWYPSTVATQSLEAKKIILKWLHRTGDPGLIDFKLHDFGFRGVSSVESAGVGGAAHLVNFKGTDNVAGLVVASRYYGEPAAGFSIPAAEHSTITSWGREHEVDAFRNMLEQFGKGPPGLVAVVSDSFDIFAACRDLWGEQLKADILAMPNGLVVRPDSGDPPTVVTMVLQLLGEKFGYSTNEKGFKVLHPKVRVIQGDGVDLKSIEAILARIASYGWSADNVGFGMGGALLQRLNRDTMKFAFKCSSITVNGAERAVYKQPVTDPGKNSKRGRLVLLRSGERGWSTERVLPEASAETLALDQLEVAFEDGRLVRYASFDQIRQRAARFLSLIEREQALDSAAEVVA